MKLTQRTVQNKNLCITQSAEFESTTHGELENDEVITSIYVMKSALYKIYVTLNSCPVPARSNVGNLYINKWSKNLVPLFTKTNRTDQYEIGHSYSLYQGVQKIKNAKKNKKNAWIDITEH